MLSIDAYSIATLQTVASLLRSGLEGGVDVTTMLHLVEQRIALPKQAGATIEDKICPSCGRGALRPVLNSEGLRIVGCRQCRYSRMDGGR